MRGSKQREEERGIKLDRLSQGKGEAVGRAWYLESAYFFLKVMRQFILERFMLGGRQRSCRQSVSCKLQLSHWCQVAQEELT